MEIEEFGKRLIETQDLDPVYTAIHGARLPKPQLARLLLGYWLFYHLGLAAWLSEHSGKAFYVAATEAARNTTLAPNANRWPRGVERRHFRGEKSLRAVEVFSREEPEYWATSLKGDFAAIFAKVKSWPMCGPWIAYKAIDMLDRCCERKIDFPLDVCLLYNEPRKGLLMLNPTEPEKELDRLLGVFKKYRAPPANDRVCYVSEVETVLCKFKSYKGGHYFVGKDIKEIRHGLEGWGDTASMLLKASPRTVCKPGELL